MIERKDKTLNPAVNIVNKKGKQIRKKFQKMKLKRF